MLAILYARYSSLEQGRGSSLDRQKQLCEDYCKRHNWTVSEYITDMGTSAWTGANLTDGNLALLTEKLEREGGTDKVIVVEQLDRISRRPPMEVMAWLGRVTATGATLATVNDNLVIDASILASQPMSLIATVFNSFRAYSESQHKSERLASAWGIKRQSEKPLTSRTVAWVELIDGELRPIPERTAIVEEIFKSSADGVGAETIAKRLNLRGVKAWGRADGWRASYIKKILSNRAVIGEYQPMISRKGQKRVPSGEPRRNYYPAAISDDLFYRVQERSRHISHASSRKFNNLFSGLAKCAACDGAMTRIYKGSSKREGSTKWEYLRCEKSRRGLCENRRNFTLGPLTDRILDRILHRAMDATSFQDDNHIMTIRERLATLRRDVESVEKRRANLLALVEDGDPDASDRYRALASDLGASKDELRLVEEQLAVASQMPTEEHLRLVSEVRLLIDSEDEQEREQARAKVKAALDSVVDQVLFYDNGYALVLRGLVGFVLFRDDGRIEEFEGNFEGSVAPPDVAAYMERRANER